MKSIELIDPTSGLPRFVGLCHSGDGSQIWSNRGRFENGLNNWLCSLSEPPPVSRQWLPDVSMHPREIISLARHRIRQIIEWCDGHPDWLHVPRLDRFWQPVAWVGKRSAIHRFDSVADGADWAGTVRDEVCAGLFDGADRRGRGGCRGYWMLDDLRHTTGTAN